jgi:hypothetical protein
MLPTIARTDLKNPTEPGDYALDGMTVQVDNQHLKAWQEMPDARFRTIMCTRAGEQGVRLALGSLA